MIDYSRLINKKTIVIARNIILGMVGIFFGIVVFWYMFVSFVPLSIENRERVDNFTIFLRNKFYGYIKPQSWPYYRRVYTKDLNGRVYNCSFGYLESFPKNTSLNDDYLVINIKLLSGDNKQIAMKSETKMSLLYSYFLESTLNTINKDIPLNTINFYNKPVFVELNVSPKIFTEGDIFRVCWDDSRNVEVADIINIEFIGTRHAYFINI